jgi:DNA gyrase/topoisomerase IV subunit A
MGVPTTLATTLKAKVDVMAEEMSPEELREFQRQGAVHRLPIVESLLRAMELGWPLIEAIEGSGDLEEARRRLTAPPFSFDEVSALHVLDMQHGRRTAQGRAWLLEEKAELERIIQQH